MTQVRETTSIKLDKTTKEKAKVIFEQLGVNMGEAINMFLTQVVLNKGIPFNIKLPNEETAQTLKEIIEGKNIEKFDIKELKR